MALKEEFDVDTAKLNRILKKIGDEIVEEDAVRIMEFAGDHYEAKMVELAPVDQGNLEGSTVVKTSGGRTITTLIKFAANYAANVHELPEHARGPKTRAKPGNEFGKAGPGFMIRVLRGENFERILGKLFQDVLREKSR